VALKTATTFQKANYKVGLFVSPHISSFRERIQINGVPISELHVEQYLQEIFDICETHSIPATFFEITTALAFHIFAKECVEVVVLETGLGGRLDATNVIRRPALSVITSIGLEHTKILGDTIEKIALEKGGIMKENCQVLVGRNAPWEVLQQCAKEKNVSEIFQCEDVLGPENDNGDQLSTAMEDYDAENSRIASAAVILVQFHQTQQRLSSGGGQEVKLISSDEIVEGVKIRPPCRFEEMDIPTTPDKMVRVILDVAHNPQAMDYLIAKLKTNYPNDRVRLVVGMSADKDLKYCTDILLGYVSHTPERIHLVEASHPRAASISAMLKANPALVNSQYEKQQQLYGTNAYANIIDDERNESSVSNQVRAALQLATKNDELVVICGSVFIMADAREELGIVEPRDSAVIAQVAGAGMRSSQENFGSDHKI
jgi:dihydrofolate synthase/folylpolyglutamate synthase